MTFDARQSKHASGSSGFAFGGMVALMAGCVFAAVLSLPQPEPAYALNQVAEHQVNPNNLSATTNEYLDTLKRVAPERHESLMVAASKPLAVGESVPGLAIDQGLQFLSLEVESVAQIPTDQIDAFLDSSRIKLWTASRARNPLCSGEFYTDILRSDPPSPEVITQKADWLMAQNSDAIMSGLTSLIQGVETLQNGIASPQMREDLTIQDEIALSGIGLSLALDEQLISALDPLKTQDERTKAVSKIDACKLAATAFSALKTLPQDTKGRTFNNAVAYFSADDAQIGPYIVQTFFPDKDI